MTEVVTAIASARAAEAKRCEAYRAIAAGIDGLKPHIVAFCEARDELIAQGRRAHSACGAGGASRADQLSTWASELIDARAEKDFLRAVLFEAGFAAFGLASQDASLRKIDAGMDVDALLEQRSQRVLHFIGLVENCVSVTEQTDQ